MWLTRTSVTSSRKQPKRLSHADIEATIFHAEMWSVNSSIERSCSLLREMTQVWLLQFYLSSLTGSKEINGPRQFRASIFHTLVKKHGVFLNNFTGRLLDSSRHCSVSVDAIASQLVRSGRCKTVDGKSFRLVSVNIFDTFSQKEFTAALQHLKPGKALGPDFIFPELIIHARAALKSWLCDFLPVCTDSKFPRSAEEHL